MSSRKRHSRKRYSSQKGGPAWAALQGVGVGAGVGKVAFMPPNRNPSVLVKVTGRIQGTSIFKPLTHEYLVETTVGDLIFTVQHRFSDFVNLHAEMREVIDGLPPTFPLQKLSLHLPSSLDERISHLQFYCNALVAFCAAGDTPPPEGLMRFLGALPVEEQQEVIHVSAVYGSAEADAAAAALGAAVAEQACAAAVLAANVVEQALVEIERQAEGLALSRLQKSARRRCTRSWRANSTMPARWSLLHWARSLPLHVLVAEALAPPPGDDPYRFLTVGLSSGDLAARMSTKGLGALTSHLWIAIERLRCELEEQPRSGAESLAEPSGGESAAPAQGTSAALEVDAIDGKTPTGSPVRKFASGREAAAAALAAARAGAAPLVSPPGSEVWLLPVKYSSGVDAAHAALAAAQARRESGESPSSSGRGPIIYSSSGAVE